MAIKEDNLIKIIWKVEDFHNWAGDYESDKEWAFTRFYIENTEWLLKLCPRTFTDRIACLFTVNMDEDLQIIFRKYDDKGNTILHIEDDEVPIVEGGMVKTERVEVPLVQGENVKTEDIQVPLVQGENAKTEDIQVPLVQGENAKTEDSQVLLVQGENAKTEDSQVPLVQGENAKTEDSQFPLVKGDIHNEGIDVPLAEGGIAKSDVEEVPLVESGFHHITEYVKIHLVDGVSSIGGDPEVSLEDDVSSIGKDSEVSLEDDVSSIGEDSEVSLEDDVSSIGEDSEVPLEDVSSIGKDSEVPLKDDVSSIGEDSEVPLEDDVSSIGEDSEVPLESDVRSIGEDPEVPFDDSIRNVDKDPEVPFEDSISNVDEDAKVFLEDSISNIQEYSEVLFEGAVSNVEEDYEFLEDSSSYIEEDTENSFQEDDIENRVHVDEDVNVHYTLNLLGKDNSPYSQVTGAVPSLNLGEDYMFSIMYRKELLQDNLPNNEFTLACEFRQLDPVDYCNGRRKDELEALSKDMRKLFETGYLSDVKLYTDDGTQIAVHWFLLKARWPKLCDNLHGKKCTDKIAVRNVSGPVLSAFVSCLYSGTLHGSDVTEELFDFTVENAPWMSSLFHTRSNNICVRTKQRQERLSFTWYKDDLRENSLPFFKVLRLHQVSGEELQVFIDIGEDEEGEKCLDLTFSFSMLSEDCYVILDCTAKAFVEDICVESIDGCCHFVSDEDEWHFGDLFQLSVFDYGPCKRKTYPRVCFEIVISDMPLESKENQVTEFHTGSQSIHNVQLLASDIRRYFHKSSFSLHDVVLRTMGGSFSSSKAFLGARSKTFQELFENREKGKITVDVQETDSMALYSVLEYLYTGWTELSTLEQVVAVLSIAKRFSLFGLVERCQKFIDKNK